MPSVWRYSLTYRIVYSLTHSRNQSLQIVDKNGKGSLLADECDINIGNNQQISIIMSDFNSEYIDEIKLDICAAPAKNNNGSDDVIMQLQRLIFMKVSFSTNKKVHTNRLNQIDYINIVKFNVDIPNSKAINKDIRVTDKNSNEYKISGDIPSPIGESVEHSPIPYNAVPNSPISALNEILEFGSIIDSGIRRPNGDVVASAGNDTNGLRYDQELYVNVFDDPDFIHHILNKSSSTRSARSLFSEDNVDYSNRDSKTVDAPQERNNYNDTQDSEEADDCPTPPPTPITPLYYPETTASSIPIITETQAVEAVADDNSNSGYVSSFYLLCTFLVPLLTYKLMHLLAEYLKLHAYSTAGTVVYYLGTAQIIAPIAFFIHRFYIVWSKVTYYGSRSFFLNGWNAWSFSGTVKQGGPVPIYSMPSSFVKSFHDGSAALDINLRSWRRSYYNYWVRHWFALPSHWSIGTFLVDMLNPNIQDGEEFEVSIPRRIIDEEEFLASDMFCVLADRCSNSCVVAGFLSQREQFGCWIINKCFDQLSARVTFDSVIVPDNTVVKTDWLVINIDDETMDEPAALYFDVAAAANNKGNHFSKTIPPPMKKAIQTPAGWCSWYHFFEKVDEDKLLSNIDKMFMLKNIFPESCDFTLFQIDDGYQRAWGDWLLLDEKKFPHQTMPSLVTKIKDANLKPGLWLAPFACDKHSHVAKNTSWILKKGLTNTPANSANCGKWFYGLDVTNPDVRKFIYDNIRTVVHDWGFKYIKLDFIYAAALAGSQESFSDRTVTRAQAIQLGFQTIRKAAGDDVFILGCGAPIGSLIGYVDANRVSADAGLSWSPDLPLPIWDKWNLPSARSMMRNTIVRMSMHNRWWINDPDCLLLRDTTQYTYDELISIATIKALSGGSLIISDDLENVVSSRLKIAQKILPTMPGHGTPLDILHNEMPEVIRFTISNEHTKRIANVFEHVYRDHCEDHVSYVHCKWESMKAIMHFIEIEMFGLPSWSLLGASNWGSKNKCVSFSASSLLRHNAYRKHELVTKPSSDVVAVSLNLPSVENRLVLLHLYEFWSGLHTYRIFPYAHTHDNANIEINLPASNPHVTQLYACRLHIDPLCPVYIGSNLHFSCGYEVDSFVFKRFKVKRSQQQRQHALHGSSYAPTYHICRIEFKAGMIRTPDWDGFIVLYLPFTPLALGEGVANNLGKAKPSTAGNVIKDMQLVNFIDEPSTGIKGTVWKIKVGKEYQSDQKIDEAGKDYVLLWW